MTLDDGLVEALRNDYRTAPITEQERVMLDYVVKLAQPHSLSNLSREEKSGSPETIST